jgi:heme A synthase
MQKFHSGWAYLALFMIVAVSFFIHAFKKEFTAKNKKSHCLVLIAIHVQLLVGIIFICFSKRI